MRITDQHKIDVAVYPQSVSASGTTSPYFSMKGYSSAAFVWTVYFHSAGLSTTSTATLYQSLNASAGTSAAGLASTTAIITASPKLTSVNFTASVTLAQGDTLSLTSYDKGGVALTALVYTLTASGTAAASVPRAINMSDAVGGTAIMSNVCTNMAASINGVDGSPFLFASATATNLTIRSLNAGETVFLVTASNTSGFTVLSALAVGMIEVKASALTVSSNFSHLAIGIVNESGYQTSAFIVRRGRKSRAQTVAVLTTLD